VGQPFIVFHTILTIGNSAHEFVILSVFAAHKTKE